MNHLKNDSQATDVERMLVLLKAGHVVNIVRVGSSHDLKLTACYLSK
jgi:hypothetical protein